MYGRIMSRCSFAICDNTAHVQWIRCSPKGSHLIHWTSAVFSHIALKWTPFAYLLAVIAAKPFSSSYLHCAVVVVSKIVGASCCFKATVPAVTSDVTVPVVQTSVLTVVAIAVAGNANLFVPAVVSRFLLLQLLLYMTFVAAVIAVYNFVPLLVVV